MQTYFQYGEKETNHLKKADKKLAWVIEQIGLIKRAVIPDLFTALVHSIVSQQISNKARDTVWQRINSGLGAITPETITAITVEELQQFGISLRKASYIHATATKIINGELDLQTLYDLPDKEVVERLTELNGIGVWTAEMLLLFSMQRPNILSWGDLAIQRGLRMVYGHSEITKELFEKYRKRYEPYASTASLYLWKVAGGAIEDLQDPAPDKKK